jgi:hypothetical protein
VISRIEELMKYETAGVEKEYKTGMKVSDKQMKQLHIVKDRALPRWNYTLRPRKNVN